MKNKSLEISANFEILAKKAKNSRFEGPPNQKIFSGQKCSIRQKFLSGAPYPRYFDYISKMNFGESSHKKSNFLWIMRKSAQPKTKLKKYFASKQTTGDNSLVFREVVSSKSSSKFLPPFSLVNLVMIRTNFIFA